MEARKLSENQQKVIEAMDKVYENLLIYKKRINIELVVLRDGKIVRIKP